MATKVYDELEIELEDGSTLNVKPLPIKGLRKFMEVVTMVGQEGIETENEAMEVFLDAAVICFQYLDSKRFKESKKEDIEDLITVPTMMKILEIAGGLKAADPNLLGAALNGAI